MRLLYVIQNKAQLRAKYGADSAEDIFDNTGAEIVFGTNDLKLTKELSERMGDDTINVTTKNRPRFMVLAELVEAVRGRTSASPAADAGAGSGPHGPVRTDRPAGWDVADEDATGVLV